MVETIVRDEAIVGRRAPRVDVLEKVTGRAKYTADLKLPGMLYGAFCRSPHAHARILRIDPSQAEALPGVRAVLTQEKLIPTVNGPYGAKGVAEPPITPGIAALQGAILDAVGVDLHEAPFTPERVRAALRAKAAE